MKLKAVMTGFNLKIMCFNLFMNPCRSLSQMKRGHVSLQKDCLLNLAVLNKIRVFLA